MILIEDAEVGEIRRLINGDLLTPHFQPILDLRTRNFLGFEALIRGPEASQLGRPDALFAAARRHSLTSEVEAACRAVSLKAFATGQLPGRLFLNASPSTIIGDELIAGADAELMASLGIVPGRVVIELTENEQVARFPGIFEVLKRHRTRGFHIAIDDLGEGFANLRLWAELRPEFVKIDRHFVDGIADDRIKYHFVRAMQDLAEICAAQLIAEGIERPEDFECLRNMGIAHAQGYLIGRPVATPDVAPTPAVLALLDQPHLALARAGHGQQPYTARRLLRVLEPIPLAARNEEAMARFEAEPELDVLPVVNGTRPVGLINRASLLDRFSRPFRRELFGKKLCDQFMNEAPLIVDEHASIQELAMMLALAPKHHLLDGFIITARGAYLGVGSSHDLMAQITELQINAARYANPLTQLPGNVPLNEHIDLMLAGERHFVVAYIDIDNFKPFNDNFGYRRGDDVIQMLGSQICEVVDANLDFVGHIGGDDFLVVFQSGDWEMRCWQLLERFSERVGSLLSPDEFAMGGYMAENRRGELVFQSLPGLSIGVVPIAPGFSESHREVAAAASEAKKQAKKAAKQGHQKVRGQVFVERRRHLIGESGFPLSRAVN